MNQSEQINELATALSKAQAEIQPALKDSVNPFFKSKYADLASVWSACKDPLTKNGLSVLQMMDYKDGQLVLLTTLAHASGQWVRSCLPVLSAKQDAQSIGSAITYMRRYSLAALVGVTTDEDDDGNAATYTQPVPPAATFKKPAAAPAKGIITTGQATELELLLDQCEDGFRSNVKDYLKKLGLTSFENLPKENYDAIRKRIVSKLDEMEAEHE